MSSNPGSRIGETLPTTARELAFRLTARDVANPAGGFGFADVTVRVVKAGPFAVVTPAVNARVAAGTSLPVAWRVNGTDLGEVACANVALRLSLDDTASIAHELAASTPNDGTEVVIVPSDIIATRARVFVECLSQPFFAVSSPFTITSK